MKEEKSHNHHSNIYTLLLGVPCTNVLLCINIKKNVAYLVYTACTRAEQRDDDGDDDDWSFHILYMESEIKSAEY